MSLLRAALADLGLDGALTTEGFDPLKRPVPLAAALPVGRLAEEAVRFADLAARHLGLPTAPLDGARIATSFTSERAFRLDGEAPVAWAPLSGFWQTADGWIRTHANYPHHRAAMLRALGIADAEDALVKESVAQALASAHAPEVEDAIAAADGVAAAVRTAEEWRAHPHGSTVAEQRLLRVLDRAAGGVERPALPEAGMRRRASSRPLDGVRVLDLTRVLAGPICTRTLALWGADVLRVDPPFLPEPEWIHLDTGPGKRSALLDLRTDRVRFAELLAHADVLVHGYRPGALGRLGLAELIGGRPSLVVASLTAWGAGPWGSRRGFDSIVQAASGIAMAESPDGERPGALPAQALDHSAGYLLAGAVAHLLLRRSTAGGSWSVETSLARIAHELLAMPRESAQRENRYEPTVSIVQTAVGAVTMARPALGADEYRVGPRPFGADEAAWVPIRFSGAAEG
ncbi:CoA transferase [Lysobacter korlensis]|uniref:CoA transferase n=1 Tax=Lysobacter korlensis TaxID=553636 RepID=A0ABV6S0P3_9GAMM